MTLIPIMSSATRSKYLPNQSKAAAAARGRGITGTQAARLLGVDQGTLGFFVKQARLSLGTLVEEGYKATDVWAALGNEIVPLVEKERPGYASPSEGLIDLMTAEGGCASVTDAVSLYRPPDPVTPQAITRLIRKGELMAYQSGSGTYYLPRWQFKPAGGLLDGLPEVLRRIRSLDTSVSVLSFFTFFLQENPLTDDETPLAALRAGRLDQVLEAAEATYAG